MLVGFAATLYLRAFFDGPPILSHLYVHGVIVTGWFVWLLVANWVPAAPAAVPAGESALRATTIVLGKPPEFVQPQAEQPELARPSKRKWTRLL